MAIRAQCQPTNALNFDTVTIMAKKKKYTLTKEVLQAANAYMPIATKQALAKQIADLCVTDIADEKDFSIANAVLALPALRGENTVMRAVLLQNVFLGHYLNIQVDDKADAFANYDYYGGTALINQIERFKADAEVKEKAFDILSDYKDFKRMVDAEILNLRLLHADALTRIVSALGVLATPENVKKMAEELQKQVEKQQAEIAQQQETLTEGNANE